MALVMVRWAFMADCAGVPVVHFRVPSTVHEKGKETRKSIRDREPGTIDRRDWRHARCRCLFVPYSWIRQCMIIDDTQGLHVGRDIADTALSSVKENCKK